MPATITKSELGRLVGLSRQRVGQLVALGLPVRKDGKLDRSAALAWVRDNIALEMRPPKP
jgi:hypothetical protein